MKSIFFTIILLTSNLSLGQTLKDLDEKRGFKDIKLGDSFAKWNKSLRVVYEKDSIKKCAFNLQTCCNQIFDQPVEVIALTFMNNKIAVIEIITKRINDNTNISTIHSPVFKSFTAEFARLFGDNYGEEVTTPQTGPEVRMQRQWLGQTTTLDLVYELHTLKTGKNFDFIQVTISDNAIFSKGF